jgi:hypothetical protein
MSVNDKNIIIYPNVGSSTDDPKIVFYAANTTSNSANITMRAYPTSNGTLSFEGSAGQLFSVTNQLTGTLFSVNDISGIPSIEVLDTGRVNLAQYNGTVVIGANTSANVSTSNTTGELVVFGGVGVTGNIYVGGTSAGSNGIYTDVLRYAANGLPWVMGSGSGGGATPSGYLANTIIVANSTGFLSNSNSFFVASNNAIVVPNVVITQAATASFPLSFGASLGNKIGLYDSGSGAGYGFGIQSAQLQIFSQSAGSCTSIGHGNSSSFTEQFRVNTVASAVNYLQVSGNTTGLSPILSAQGSDTNVDVTLVAKGTGSTYIKSGGNTAFKIDGAYGGATGVNYWNPSGSGTGNGLRMDIGGSDADVSMFFIAKGLGSIFFNSGGSSGTTQLKVSPIASAVNFVQVSGAATGSGPSISAQGSDGNASLLINSKGNSDLFLRAGTAGWVSLEPGGNRAFAVRHITSQVNYLTVWGSAAAGNNTTLSAEYSSAANVAINLVPKGNAAVMITGNTTGIIAAANSIYVGDRVGYANANNISVVYQSYNSSTNSLDVVFG